ncbi:hypothetical protein BC830DRAFT_1167141 [Chytriomyces sp. MP71]|nr:hypothetical protein BC830DRAFT_1167141 [Chytriomyces sp. MP71]
MPETPPPVASSSTESGSSRSEPSTLGSSGSGSGSPGTGADGTGGGTGGGAVGAVLPYAAFSQPSSLSNADGSPVECIAAEKEVASRRRFSLFGFSSSASPVSQKHVGVRRSSFGFGLFRNKNVAHDPVATSLSPEVTLHQPLFTPSQPGNDTTTKNSNRLSIASNVLKPLNDKQWKAHTALMGSGSENQVTGPREMTREVSPFLPVQAAVSGAVGSFVSVQPPRTSQSPVSSLHSAKKESSRRGSLASNSTDTRASTPVPEFSASAFVLVGDGKRSSGASSTSAPKTRSASSSASQSNLRIKNKTKQNNGKNHPAKRSSLVLSQSINITSLHVKATPKHPRSRTVNNPDTSDEDSDTTASSSGADSDDSKPLSVLGSKHRRGSHASFNSAPALAKTASDPVPDGGRPLRGAVASQHRHSVGDLTKLANAVTPAASRNHNRKSSAGVPQGYIHPLNRLQTPPTSNNVAQKRNSTSGLGTSQSFYMSQYIPHLPTGGPMMVPPPQQMPVFPQMVMPLPTFYPVAAAPQPAPQVLPTPHVVYAQQPLGYAHPGQLFAPPLAPVPGPVQQPQTRALVQFTRDEREGTKGFKDAALAARVLRERARDSEILKGRGEVGQ